MKVRISTLNKGNTFTYKGRSYTMGTPGAKKDARGTFRWVVRHNDDGSTNWTKFRVHGAQMVTLTGASDAVRATKKSAAKPVTPATRTKVAKVLVSKGAYTYRVTASWWVGVGKGRTKQSKEFRVNADTAAQALSRVPKPSNQSVKVTFTVAKVS